MISFLFPPIPVLFTIFFALVGGVLVFLGLLSLPMLGDEPPDGVRFCFSAMVVLIISDRSRRFPTRGHVCRILLGSEVRIIKFMRVILHSS